MRRAGSRCMVAGCAEGLDEEGHRRDKGMGRSEPFFCFWRSERSTGEHMDTQALAQRFTEVLADLRPGMPWRGIHPVARTEYASRLSRRARQGSAGDERREVGIEDCESGESRAVRAAGRRGSDSGPLRAGSVFAGSSIVRCSRRRSSPRCIGQEVKVLLKAPMEGRRRCAASWFRWRASALRWKPRARHSNSSMRMVESARVVPDWVALGYAPQPKRGGKTPAKKAPK